MCELAISGTLESLDKTRQHAAINKFLEGELAVERQKIALLHQQGSHQSASGSSHTRRLETLNIDISKYEGDEGNSLLR